MSNQKFSKNKRVEEVDDELMTDSINLGPTVSLPFRSSGPSSADRRHVPLGMFANAGPAPAAAAAPAPVASNPPCSASVQLVSDMIDRKVPVPKALLDGMTRVEKVAVKPALLAHASVMSVDPAKKEFLLASSVDMLQVDMVDVQEELFKGMGAELNESLLENRADIVENRADINDHDERIEQLEEENEILKDEVRELKNEVRKVKNEVRELKATVSKLVAALQKCGVCLDEEEKEEL
ncbi:hypothetical protein QBC40DRAFT_318881 [Triangularia verruculosa]|uniref:Uncharacterized protein n=1 Tax=Triangularia verruculosa TaxID=2587418 RepID=A0AAN7AMV7_9PEZI|nr:hypothetical protein QBC40DRAFT_318881 [Triangularia verruculosa]